METTSLSRLLEDLSGVIADVPGDVYRAELLPGVSGSIGAHVRHVLDHVAALVACSPDQPLSYDHRDRGTSIERNPLAAQRRIAELRDTLAGLAATSSHEPIVVSALVAAGDPPIVGRSSRARELAFVVSHTVHHQAIIAMLLSVVGAPVPERFGVAASTPRVSATPAPVALGA